MRAYELSTGDKPDWDDYNHNYDIHIMPVDGFSHRTEYWESAWSRNGYGCGDMYIYNEDGGNGEGDSSTNLLSNGFGFGNGVMTCEAKGCGSGDGTGCG